MKSRFADARFIARLFWVLALTSIAIWALIPSYARGWDVAVYHNAILSLRAHHDPYADAIAIQQAYQSNPLAYHGAPIPYSYVYSPLTLPLLRGIARFPLALVGGFYWTLYFLLLGLPIWVEMRFVEPSERVPFAILSSLVIFFPGLLYNDALFSGNIAYLLYAAALGSAWVGWRRGRWGWFYAAVLVAGCFKTPMLTLLAIPVLSARRQWLPATATGALGIALFLLQPRLWPVLFSHYMQAVELQFAYNRDFSSSPAGLVANALFHVAPYALTSLLAYLAYAVPLGAVLLFLSRKFLHGFLTLNQWVPLLLIGTILLNPRIMEYDLAPITLALALVAWRFLARERSILETSIRMAVFFAGINLLASLPHTGLTNPPWKLTAGCTLLAVFAVGAWDLLLEVRSARTALARPGHLSTPQDGSLDVAPSVNPWAAQGTQGQSRSSALTSPTLGRSDNHEPSRQP
jgi:hypothetical protein